MREDAPRIIGLIFHSSGPLHFSCHIVFMVETGKHRWIILAKLLDAKQ